MVIALNGKILDTEKPAGPEYFTYNLYKTLFKNDTQNTYVVYYKYAAGTSFLKKLMDQFPNVKFTQVPSYISWTHLGLSQQLVLDNPDVYFSPEHTLPLLIPQQVKTAVMIHGLEYKTNNQLKSYSFKYLIFPLILRWICYKANKVVVPSEYTKTQIIADKLIAHPEKITVIDEGVSSIYRELHTTEEIQTVTKKYHIDSDYLLFISTIQPRKNVSGLIKAFAKAAYERDLVLVLAGKKGWNFQDIFKTIEEQNLEKRVIWLDWVPEEDLPYLLEGAKGYVNFSFEEGFSLTLIEAMASKVCAAVSNIPPHKVLGQDAVYYANPKDIEEMSGTLTKLIDNDNNQMINKAYDYSQRYTWENTSSQLIDIFNQLS